MSTETSVAGTSGNETKHRQVFQLDPYVPGTNFEIYELKLRAFFEVNKCAANSRVNILITLLPTDVIEKLVSLCEPTRINDKKLDELLILLRDFYCPKKNVILERFEFHKSKQENNELVKDYIVRLRKKAANCKFGEFLDESLRDKLILGVKDESVQGLLLMESTKDEKLSFEKASNLAISTEMSKSGVTDINKDSARFSIAQCDESNINYLNRKFISKSQFKENNNVTKSKSSIKVCSRCGSNTHDEEKCYAKNRMCRKCGKKGHYEKMCKILVKLISEGKCEDLDSENKGFTTDFNWIGSIKDVNKGLFTKVWIENKAITMEVDTGACSSVISETIFNDVFSFCKISQIDKSLCTVTGENIKVIGKAIVRVKLDGSEEECRLELIIIKSKKNFVPLLGRSWLNVLRPDWRVSLIGEIKFLKSIDNGCMVSTQVVDFLRKLKSEFPWTFCAKLNEPILGYKAEIHMKDNTVPVFCRPYSLPFPLKESVDKELERLQEEGVLIPVEHSLWATPIVVAPKGDGKIRICMDCKVSINKFITTKFYPMPCIEDLFVGLSKFKVFAKIDLNGAYQQLALSENSRKYMTIHTHKGLFQYTRLPFGVSSAPAIFQCTIEQILKGMDFLRIYLDDILVGGISDEDLANNLLKVFGKLNDHRVKINESKCEFFKSEVSYLGHVISNKGIKPNPKKLEAIRKAPPPKDITQLRAYLGLLNYYSRFVPNLSAKLSPLYKLLCKNVNFSWTPECNSIFEESKNYLVGDQILELYDPKKPIIIYADASPYGYGAILAHITDGVEKPVLFASCTLNEHERGYSQIHREAGAIMFAFHKFHKYVYGVEVIVRSDHEPLKEIFNPDKSNSAVALGRLKRWAVVLSMYKYKLEHRPGKLMGHVDALSRLPLENCSEFDEDYEGDLINFISEHKELSINFDSIVDSQKKCQLICTLFQYVKNGWPGKIDGKLQPYFLKRNSFHTENGVLFYRDRVVVPEELRKSVLSIIHSESHTGIVRMKSLARSVVWWLGMDQSIEEKVNSCMVCQMTRNSVVDKTVSSWPESNFPLERVHTDLFYFGNQTFLILFDTYSKYIDIFKLQTATSQSVLAKIKKFCAYFGLIKEIVSDNGPPFNSADFINWCQRNHIKVTKSPPYHPASNGAAERAVQTAKSALKKIIVENKNQHVNLEDSIQNFLFNYRNTQSTVTNQSPSDLMLAYKTRTFVTVLNKSAKFGEEKEKVREGERDDKQCEVKFKIGDRVFYKNHLKEMIKWIPCIITGRKSSFVYVINLKGNVRTAHVNQLRKEYQPKIDLYLAQGLGNTDNETIVGNPNINAGNPNIRLSRIPIANNNSRPKRVIVKPNRFKDYEMN